MPGFQYKSSHEVPLERPERYVKQLNSHLSKKVPLQEGFLLFPDLGAAEARVSGNTVCLKAYADNEEALEKIENTLVKHLYKFAKISGDAHWQRIGQ
jgi:hypothetical protein